MENYLEEQQRNRREALEYISKWVDCYYRGDRNNRNMMEMDFSNMMKLKSQMNLQTGSMLSTAIEVANSWQKSQEEHGKI